MTPGAHTIDCGGGVRIVVESDRDGMATAVRVEATGALIVCSVSPSLRGRVDAGAIVRELTNGRGGGSAGFAQGMVVDQARFDEVMRLVRERMWGDKGQ